jgi:UDP-glucose 4-epimerase
MNKSQGPIVITGATGFIGTYLAHYFSEQGWSVIGVDRTPANKDLLVNLSSFCCLKLPDPAFSVLLKDNSPQVCIHCAGTASVSQSIIDVSSDFYSNTALTFEVLNTVHLSAPQCRLIFLSSAAVYGNPPDLPVSEDAPLCPISPYGYHKLLCEKLAEEFYTVYHVPTCVARIFSAYGPGLRRQVLWDICQKALNSDRVELLGTGDETRDFVHVQDVARGIALIASRAAFRAEVYNLATGKETRIRDLAEILIAALGRDVEVEFTGALRAGDPLRWCADISRLAKLGYRPQTPVAIGAADYARWVLENRAAFPEGSC